MNKKIYGNPMRLLIYAMFRELSALINRYRKWYIQFRAKHEVGAFEEPMIAKGDTKLSRNTWLGKNCNFNGMQIEGGGRVEIGDNFHSGKECMIITEFHNYRGDQIPYDNKNVIKEVSIGDQVWLGNRVTIIGGISIGEGAIIQAGSVVVSDIPTLAIAGGAPAKVFSYRDQNHYEQLKSREAFN